MLPFSETISIPTYLYRCPFFPILAKNHSVYLCLINFYGGYKVNDSKETRKKRVGWFIIGNGIVWGLVIIGTALVLRGTGLWGKILPIVGGGAAFSEIILSSLLVEKK